MPIGRRLSSLLVVLALVASPAVVLRLFCVGNSCDAGEASADAAVPFCPLPQALRRQIAAGFREGRSPDVIAATAEGAEVFTATPGGERIPWPGVGGGDTLTDTRVPIAFFGEDIASSALPDGIRLDAIAPTLEEVAGFRRDHPDVRTGEALESVANDGRAPSPLVVLIAWKGLGTADLEADPAAWPFLRKVLRRGPGTLEGETGSLPLDPAATLTTIGTGGLPSVHGITGATVRDDDGDVGAAWGGPGAGSVIATFADDLDRGTSERSVVGAVLTDPTDRGIVGDGWYLDARDRDPVRLSGGGQSGAVPVVATIVKSHDVGRDSVTDMLAVVLEGTIGDVDAQTADVVTTIERLVPRATFVVAGTGSLRTADGIGSDALAADVDTALGASVVAGASADGLFLDRDVLVERTLTAQQVADVLGRQRTPGGDPVFADASPSFAVAFSRYC